MGRLSGLVALVGCVLLAAAILTGCGTVPPGEDSLSDTSVVDSAGSSADTPSAPMTSTPSATATPETPGEQPPALEPGEMAYVEITQPSLLVASAEGRRILSPGIDAEAIEGLLDAYATSAMVVYDEPRFEDMDVRLVFHLRNGSALVLWGDLAQPKTGVLMAFEGRPAEIPQGDLRHHPSLLAGVESSALFALADSVVTGAPSADAAGATTDSLPADMPADFGFTAAFGIYGKMVLDTFTGQFHKDMVLPQHTTGTADLRLTGAEFQEAYSRLAALDPLSYPTDFVPKQTGGVTPNQAYYLRFRAGDVEKEIRWNDTTLSDDRMARELRDWFKWLEELVYDKPEYKALPDFRGGYA